MGLLTAIQIYAYELLSVFVYMQAKICQYRESTFLLILAVSVNHVLISTKYRDAAGLTSIQTVDKALGRRKNDMEMVSCTIISDSTIK